MKGPIFKGSGVALVTPFTDDGVDIASYQRLIQWQISMGTDALITCGTTGEPSTMTEQEQEQVIIAAVEAANGQVPVIAGIGGNDTAKVMRMAKLAKSLGVDGLLAVTPYYNKTTQKGLIAHFHAVANTTDLPIILYNVPSRTGLNIAPATYHAIASHPNIAGMKEASGNIEQIVEMARLCPDIALYSGSDDHILPLLSLGGAGVISVVGNVLPKMTHDLCAKWFQGDIVGARELQFLINPLVKTLFLETNPIPVKTALNLMGHACGPLRMPLVPMEDANLASMKAAMQELGLLERSL